MKRKKAIYSFCLILSACSPAPAEQCIAPKHWTRQEQIEIAKQRNQLPPDNILRPVLDDWERMRRESKC